MSLSIERLGGVVARYTVARADRRHRVRLRPVPACRRWRRPLGDAGHRAGDLRGPRHRCDRHPLARAARRRPDLCRSRHRAGGGHRRPTRLRPPSSGFLHRQPGRDPRSGYRQPPALARRDRREPHRRSGRRAPRRMASASWRASWAATARASQPTPVRPPPTSAPARGPPSARRFRRTRRRLTKVWPVSSSSPS